LAFDCLIAWPISCYVSVQVHQFSVSVQNLNQYLFKIYLKSFKYQNLLKSQNLLNLPGNFGSSGHFLGSSKNSTEVPDFLRKFRTFCGSPEHCPEVSDFIRRFRSWNFFSSHIKHTPSSLISPKLFPQLPAPQTLPSLPLKPLSLQTLTPKLKSLEVPQIPGSLDSSG